MDIAALGYEIDSSQTRTAASDLDKMNAAAARAEKGQKSLEAASKNLLRDAKGRFLSSAQSAQKYGAEIEALRMKYNPLYAASKQFEAQQSELKRALELGAISVAQYDAALANLQAGMIRSASASTVYGKGMSNASMHTANVFAQLNDIGVMMASGQNPLILAIQQGTQLNQVWGKMGGNAASIGSAIRGAFASMLNPVSLVTIAVIAGGAALVQWGLSAIGAEEDTRTFDDALGDLQNSVSNLDSLTSLYAGNGLESLMQKYGQINAELTKHLELMREAEIRTALQNARDTITEMQDDLSGLFSTTTMSLQSMFNATIGGAQQLSGAMNDVKSATNIDQQVAAFGRLRDLILNATGGIGNMTDEQFAFYKKVQDSYDSAQQLQEAIKKGEIAANGLAGVDITSGISSAASEAVRLAQYLGISLATAQALANLGPQGIPTDPSGKRYSGRGGDPREMGGSILDVGVYEADKWLAAWDEAHKKGGRKKKGGGGGAKAENAFEQLKISLQKDSEFQIEKYEKDLAVLKDALNRKLTTQKEYEELSKLLKTEYWGSEYEKQVAQNEMEQALLEEALEKKYLTQEQYQQRLAELRAKEMEQTLGHYNTLFGNMASIAQAGGDKTTGVVKAFSIAQGLINSYLAYTQVLADPSLVGRPFLRTALAASTLAAGLAQVANMKSGGSGGSSRSTNSGTATAKAEPDRVTRVELQGDEWLVNLADSLMTQIYDASKNGRVIVSRA